MHEAYSSSGRMTPSASFITPKVALPNALVCGLPAVDQNLLLVAHCMDPPNSDARRGPRVGVFALWSPSNGALNRFVES